MALQTPIPQFPPGLKGIMQKLGLDPAFRYLAQTLPNWLKGIGAGVPAGGTASQILEKNSSADYDASWKDISTVTHGIPAGGTTNQVLEKNSATDFDVAWKNLPTPPTVPTSSPTVTDETTYGIAPAVGTPGTYANGDHTHGTPAAPAKVRYVPDSVTLNVGTLNSGDVDSVKVPFDANVYSVQEHSGVPGYDIQFDFADVLSFNRINLHHAYFGANPTHFVSIQLYNFSTAAWNHVTVFLNGANYNQWLSLEGIPCANYIDAGVVKLKYYHESSGDPSHQIAVDYVSLVQDFDA